MGDLYISIDGGLHWRLVARSTYPFMNRHPIGNMPTGGFLRSLVVTSHGVLYMSRGKFGLVACSLDGGRTWRHLLQDDGSGGYTLQFVDARHGWASSTGVIYRTTDGGRNWSLSACTPGYVAGCAREDR